MTAGLVALTAGVIALLLIKPMVVLGTCSTDLCRHRHNLRTVRQCVRRYNRDNRNAGLLVCNGSRVG
jgi:hypothetical protein